MIACEVIVVVVAAIFIRGLEVEGGRFFLFLFVTAD
jgi:hypothetical protein